MKKIYMVFCLMVLTTGTALAEGLRCGTKVVAIGDHKIDVQEKCGQPRSRDSRNVCESKQLKNGVYKEVCDEVEEWTYKPSQGQLLTLIEIRANRVSNITYGSR